jgi:hypothetical protein
MKRRRKFALLKFPAAPKAASAPSAIANSSMQQILDDLQLLALSKPETLEYLADVTRELTNMIRERGGAR